MPSISKARIVNFFYNDGARFIPDVIFNFEDSNNNPLNTLLDLENGGGKTVLIQLLFQPIIPCAKIQDRKISEYFRKSTDCAYILLEWKLDCSTDYLLTGIALTSSQNTNENEESKTVRHYTFINHYGNMGDKYDIVNFPLSKTMGGKFIPTAFNDVRNIAKNMEYYNSDEVRKYHSRLEEFGIIHSEWNNILVKINEREGGIEKFIEGYKTTDNLLDDFIIPGISEGMNVTDRDSSIDTMFLNYAESCAQAEDKIKLRENITNFTNKLDELKPKIINLWNLSEENKNAINQLFDYIYSLKFVISKTNDELNRLISNKKTIDEKTQHILLEKYSDKFYRYTEELEKVSQLAKEMSEQAKKAEEHKKQSEHRKKVLLAADKYSALKELHSEETTVKTMLKKLTDSNFDEHTEALRFSLNTAAKKLLDETAKQLSELSLQIEENTAAIEKLKNEKSELSKKSTQLKSDTDRLFGQKEQLNKDIKAELKKLEIIITQMLDESFNQEEINETRQQLQTEINRLDNEISELNNEYDELDITAANNQEKLRILEISQHDISKQIETIKSDIDKYNGEFKAVCEVLYSLSLNENLAFTGEPQKVLTSLIDELNDKINSTKRKIEVLYEQKKNALNGTIHLPQSAVDFLDSTGVEYISGTAYLSEQNGLRETILNTEPLVAFSVIVSSEKERKAIFENITNASWVMSAIPVFTLSEIAKIADGVHICDDIFITAYSHDYFSNKKTYIETIDEQIRKNQDNLTILESKLKEKIHSLEIISDFNYAESYRRDMELNLETLKETKRNNETDINNLNTDNKKIAERKSEINETEKKIIFELNILNQKNSRFDELCKKMSEYYEISQTVSNNNSALSSINRQLKFTSDSLLSLKENHNSITEKQNLFFAKKEEYQLVISETYGKSADLITDSYDNLKTQYETCKKKFSDDEQALTNRLSECKEKIIKAENGLKNIGVSEAEYSVAVYSIEAVNKAESEIEKAEEEWKALFKLQTEYESQSARLSESKNDAYNSIAKMEKDVLPKSQIGADFDNRIKKCKAEFAAVSDNISEKTAEIKKHEMELKRAEKIAEKHCDSSETHSFIDIYDNMSEDLRNKIEKSEKTLKHNENLSLEWVKENLSDFAEKEHIFKNVIEQIKSFVNETSLGDKYFTMRLKLEQDIETFNKQKARLDTELSDIESSKNELVSNCLQRSIRLYSNLKLLSSKSKVKIFEQYKQMIKIKIPDISDNDVSATTRITQYIESCVHEYLSVSEQRDIKKCEQAAHRYMNLRRLLNCYIGQSEIPVDVYKIGNSPQTSSYRKWERALKANSGGEKFVVFFALILSMMNYARGVTESLKDSSAVIILDNPFGPISSSHLLTPMFAIAEKFRIQLICFTHLATAEIVKCFNNKYTLKLRARPLSRIETLEAESQQLEHAFYRAEQISFL